MINTNIKSIITKIISLLLTLVILFSIPVTVTEASSQCPPHNYVFDGTFTAPSYSHHYVQIVVWNPSLGRDETQTVQCTIITVYDVYRHKCSRCGDVLTYEYEKYKTHSLNFAH